LVDFAASPAFAGTAFGAFAGPLAFADGAAAFADGAAAFADGAAAFADGAAAGVARAPVEAAGLGSDARA
jgi:hypothetical protein